MKKIEKSKFERKLTRICQSFKSNNYSYRSEFYISREYKNNQFLNNDALLQRSSFQTFLMTYLLKITVFHLLSQFIFIYLVDTYIFSLFVEYNLGFFKCLKIKQTFRTKNSYKDD